MKIEHKPVYKPDDCPHEVLDRRGSSKATIMFYCRQCCAFVDARKRADAEAFDKTKAHLSVASTTQQRQAEKILDERTLNREQVGIAFTLLQGKCTDSLSTKDIASTTELRGLWEDAMDQVLNLSTSSSGLMAIEDMSINTFESINITITGSVNANTNVNTSRPESGEKAENRSVAVLVQSEVAQDH